MQDFQGLTERLLRRSIATEGLVDCRVDPVVEGIGAQLLRLPYVEVAQSPIWPANAQVNDASGERLGAEVVWSMNAPEYWVLLVEERGWSPRQFEAWISDSWRRLLLRGH